MDNLLMLYSKRVQDRYETVLDTINYKLNSFYDSYNSLVEAFLKELLNDNKGSIYELTKRHKDYLINEIKFDQKSFNKLQDYANKINKHKHKVENEITLDNVINYMKVFYDLVYAVSLYKKYTIPKFDENFFKSIYGDKDNSIILEQINKIEHQNFLRASTQSFINKSLDKKYYYILLVIYFISLITFISLNFKDDVAIGYLVLQIPTIILVIRFNHFKKEVVNVNYFSSFLTQKGIYGLYYTMKISHWMILVYSQILNSSLFVLEFSIISFICIVINSLSFILMFYNISRIIKGYDIMCFTYNNKKKYFSIKEEKWIS